MRAVTYPQAATRLSRNNASSPPHAAILIDVPEARSSIVPRISEIRAEARSCGVKTSMFTNGAQLAQRRETATWGVDTTTRPDSVIRYLAGVRRVVGAATAAAPKEPAVRSFLIGEAGAREIRLEPGAGGAAPRGSDERSAVQVISRARERGIGEPLAAVREPTEVALSFQAVPVVKVLACDGERPYPLGAVHPGER